jgi:parallel beta-helix repeat protein
MSRIFSQKVLVVNQLHPDASDANPGTEELPFRTIQAAANQAFAGVTVLVRAGIYRETVAPSYGGKAGQPITYQAAPGEKVFIKGSEVYTGTWECQRGEGNVYAAQVPLVESGENPFALSFVDKTPDYVDQMGTAVIHRTLGQIFLDGNLLDEVDRVEHLEAMPGTWMAKENGHVVVVHFPEEVSNPARHLIEFTMRRAVFRPAKRGLGYIILRGFILEHAATPSPTYFWEKSYAPQQGLVSCRSGHHWVVENNIIRYAKAIGIDIGSEGRMDELNGDRTPGLVGYHRIVKNVISDNGQGGICGLGHIGSEIIGNVLERNNNLGAISWEEAAIKTHFYIHGRIEGNLIRNNFCNGIWLDNVYQDIRVTRNVILNNQGAGIFCEMGSGPCLIDNNVIGLHTMGNSEIGGNGLYGHDAGGITAVHNLFCQNAGFGVYLKIAVERNHTVYPENITTFNELTSGEVPSHCKNIHLANNIFIENHRGALNLPFPGEKASDLYSNHNLFCDWGGAGLFAVNATAGPTIEQVQAAYAAAAGQAKALELGSQVLMALQDWQKMMGMDRESAVVATNNVYWQMLHPGPGPWLTFRIEMPPDLQFQVQPGVNQDLYGRMLPDKNPLPGPFQQIGSKGAFHFRLWPLPEEAA